MTQESLSILLIEDSSSDASLIEELLRGKSSLSSGAGFQLNHVCSLDDALQQIAASSFQAILCDLALSDSQGLDTVRQIKAAAPQIPLIILTGNDSHALAMQAMQQGAQDYLDKNRLDTYSLTRAIRYAIERQRLETAQLQAEQAVRTSEARFRALTEHSADGIALVNATGIILYASPAYSRILGYTIEELTGTSAFEFIHPDDITIATEKLGAAVQSPGIPIAAQVRKRHKDGTWRWLKGAATNLLDDPSVQAIVTNFRDITERKLADDELRYQAMIAESISDAVVTTDTESRIRSWNKAAERLYGYKAEEVLGRSTREVLKGEYVGLSRDEARQILHSNGHWEGEVVAQRSDGTTVHISLSSSLLRDSSGQVTGMLAVNRDITDRKHAEAKIQQSERLFRSLIENSADAIALLDKNGTLMRFASPAASRILGYQIDDTAGRNVFDFIHPDDQARAEKLLQSLIQESASTLTFDLRLRHKNGSWRSVEVVGSNLLHDPAVSAIVVNYVDITERREAEAQQRYQATLLAHVHDSVISTDENYVIVTWNKAAEAMFGYTAAELVGRETRAILETDYGSLDRDDILRQLVRTGKWIGEVRLRHKDGHWVETTASIATIYDLAGRITGYLTIYHDITTRKESERALIRQADELTVLHAVAEAGTTTTSEDELFERVTDIIGATLYSDHFGIMVLDAEHKELIAHASYYGVTWDRSTGRVPIGQGITGRVAATGQPWRVADVRTEPAYRAGSPATLSELCVPIQIESRIYGVINAESDRLDAFTAADEQLLITLARQLATAIEKLRLFGALSHSERKYRSVMEQLPVISYEVTLADPPGAGNRTSYISPQVETILGYSPEEWMADNDLWIKLLHPDDSERVLAEVFGGRDRNRTFDIEYRSLTRDGRVVWFRNRNRYLPGSGDEPARLYGLMLDITAIKQAEEAVRESESIFRRSIEAAGAVPYRRDHRTNQFIYMGEGILAITGYTAEEFTTELLETMVAENHPGGAVRGLMMDEAVQMARLGYLTNWRNDVLLRTRDGSLRWVADSSVDFRDEAGVVVGSIGILQDITDRKEAEAKLRQAEERYRMLVEQLPLITYIVEPGENGKTLYVSPQIESILGFTTEEWLADPEIWHKQIHPDDRERVLRANTQRQTSGQFVDEYRLLAKDGRAVWLHNEAHQVFDEAGQLLYLQGVEYDITERKQAEAEVRESELRYRAITEDQIELICRFRADGTLTFVNEAYCRYFGKSRDELIGRAYAPLMLPEDYARATSEFEKISREQPVVTIEHRVIAQGGIVRWMRWIDRAIFEGDTLVEYQGVGEDITERKQVEEALRSSEERFRLVARATNDAVWDWDLKTDQSWWNETFFEQFGYSPDTIEPDSKSWTTRLHPEDRDRVWNGILAAIHSGQDSWQDEYRFRRADGSYAFINDRGYIVRNSEGQPIRMLGSMMDVSERKQRDRELQAVASLSAALRGANSPSGMVPIITHQVMELLEAESTALLLRDPATDELVVELATGLHSQWVGRRIPQGAGISGHVFATGQAYLTNDLKNDPWIYDPASFGNQQALVCAPLIAQGEILGSVWASRSSKITPGELRILTALADIAANAIRRAALHNETRRRAEQLAAVNRLSRALAETFDVPSIHRQVHEIVKQLFPDIATLFISSYSESSQLIRCEYAVQDGATLDPTKLPLVSLKPPGEGTQSAVIHSRQPLILNDLQTALKADSSVMPASSSSPEELPQSSLLAPMLARGIVRGVVQIQSYSLNRFTTADTETLSFIANAAAIALENARLFTETQRRLQRLQALHTIDEAVSASLDLRFTLNVVLGQAIEQLRVDAASVLLLNSYTQTLEYSAGLGFRTRSVERSAIRLGQGVTGRAVLDRRPTGHVPVNDGSIDFVRRILLADEGFVSYYATPIIAKGTIKGVLEVFRRSPIESDVEWEDFITTLARQAAIAIENIALYADLQRSNTELSLAYDTTLEGWSHALDLRDEETEGHSQRVTDMSVQLARTLGFGEAEIIHLRRGALLHDIGKMGVPDAILLKPGALSDDEWVLMRKHPQYAYDLLHPVHFLRSALDIPYCHHEKWDGTGYPRGLKGPEIPLAARIFAVVDVWDALSSDRPYRKGWSPEKVRDHLIAQSDKHFDPAIVDAFLPLIS